MSRARPNCSCGPRDLKLADSSADAIPARVIACAAPAPPVGSSSTLGEGLPPVEIELPLDHAVGKGDVLAITFATFRLFTAR